MYRAVGIVAACLAGSVAWADPTGAELAALSVPNQVLGADNRISIMLIEPLPGFAQELSKIDREGVIDIVDDTGRPEGIILFAPNWTAAAFMAQSVGGQALSQRLAANEGTGRGIDIATVPSAGAEPLHFYSVVPNTGGQNIPSECYARLFASVIYAGGQPEVFRLAACLEALK